MVKFLEISLIFIITIIFKHYSKILAQNFKGFLILHLKEFLLNSFIKVTDSKEF